MPKQPDEASLSLEEILEQILGIEAEAEAIVSEAEEMATMLLEQSKLEREQALAKAREEAEEKAKKIRQDAAQEAEKERQRILAGVGDEQQQIEKKGNFDQAVAHVVQVITGQKEA